MRPSSKVDTYSDKQVFIGIDGHKRTDSVVSSIDGIVIKKWTPVASPEKLVKQLKTVYPQADIYSAYEAGFSGFVLHRA